MTTGVDEMQSDPQPILRAAHPSEASAIASMSRLQVEYGLNWRWTPTRVRRQIADKDTMVLVATRDGELAGFAIMKFGDLKAHLYLLAVEPRYRRGGIGAAMLAWLEKSCTTAGIQIVRLEVRADNQPALAFYKKLGYRNLGQLAGYYERRESAVVLGKTLAQKIRR